MPADLPKRLLDTIRAREWMRPGERVAVAVSGGADSVALLLLLRELQSRLGIVLSVVHFNHRLRGKASDSDELFVAKLAERCGLPVHIRREDIGARAQREKANVEEAGRKARYGYFERLIQEGRASRIAVAHTADDQAETVLAHMMRGTGLAGLGGIHPQAGGVIRPLLATRRNELRLYLKAQHQSWREDRSNRDTQRMRARIRKKLLPLIEREFPSGAVEHLCRLADLAREDEAFLESAAEARLRVLAEPAGAGFSVRIKDLLPGSRNPGSPAETESPSLALAKRVIRGLAAKVKTRRGQLGSEHVDRILELAVRGENGKALELPGGLAVGREADRLVFRARGEPGRRPRKARKAPAYSHNIDIQQGPARVSVPELQCVFRLRVIDWPSQRRDTNYQGTVLDRDRLRQPLLLRNWRAGDRLHAVGHQKPRKLTRFFNETGVSRWVRDSWPVLTSNGTVAWVRGLPVAAEFAATESTRAGILIVEEAN